MYEAATQGDWNHTGAGIVSDVADKSICICSDLDGKLSAACANAEFIAHAHNVLLEALDEIDKLDCLLHQLRQEARNILET